MKYFEMTSIRLEGAISVEKVKIQIFDAKPQKCSVLKKLDSITKVGQIHSRMHWEGLGQYGIKLWTDF